MLVLPAFPNGYSKEGQEDRYGEFPAFGHGSPVGLEVGPYMSGTHERLPTKTLGGVGRMPASPSFRYWFCLLGG